MSMTFTKLFTSITESTVWCEPDKVRLVWITMLAMADRRGRVWGSIPGLANRARVPTEDCREALERFLSPDPDSRTKDFEGRRIAEIEGGWRLLNYEKYRAIRDSESIKESKRAYMANRREVERNAHSGTPLPSVERGRDNAEAEAYAEAELENKSAPKGALFEEFWNAYKEAGGEKVGRGQAEKAWKKINPDHALLTVMLTALQSQKQERAAFAAAGQFYEGWKHPATWLNGKCWLDEPRTLTDTVNEKPRRLSGPELVERATAERKREREQKLISR